MKKQSKKDKVFALLGKPNEVDKKQYLSQDILIPKFKDYEGRFTIKSLNNDLRKYFTIENDPFGQNRGFREIKKNEILLKFFKYDKEDSSQHSFIEKVVSQNKIDEYEPIELMMPNEGVTSFGFDPFFSDGMDWTYPADQGHTFSGSFFWTYDNFEKFKSQFYKNDKLKENKTVVKESLQDRINKIRK